MLFASTADQEGLESCPSLVSSCEGKVSSSTACLVPLDGSETDWPQASLCALVSRFRPSIDADVSWRGGRTPRASGHVRRTAPQRESRVSGLSSDGLSVGRAENRNRTPEQHLVVIPIDSDATAHLAPPSLCLSTPAGPPCLTAPQRQLAKQSGHLRSPEASAIYDDSFRSTLTVNTCAKRRAPSERQQ